MGLHLQECHPVLTSIDTRVRRYDLPSSSEFGPRWWIRVLFESHPWGVEIPGW